MTESHPTVSDSANTSYQRWYDHDPALVEAIEVLRQFETELKSQAEVFLDRLKETVGADAIENFYAEILASRGDKMGRRWYDSDPTLSKAIELLRVAPPEAQKQIAQTFLSGLQIKALSQDNNPIPAEVSKAIEEFNSGAYFECHETLEALWLKETGETKLFLQGLIQAAAGLLKITHQHEKGSIRLLSTALEKLQPLQNSAPFTSWLALKPLVSELGLLLSQILSAGLNTIEINTLPKIKGSDVA